MRRLAISAICATYLATGVAQTLSVADLEGRWEFVSWYEDGDPNSVRPVGIMMDFRPDGTVISHRPDGPSTSTIRIDGDTIYYVDDNGEQTWKVVSFTAGESLVVDNRGAIMTLEPR